MRRNAVARAGGKSRHDDETFQDAVADGALLLSVAAKEGSKMSVFDGIRISAICNAVILDRF